MDDSDSAQISLDSGDSQKVFILNILELISVPSLIQNGRDKDYLDLLIDIGVKPNFLGDSSELVSRATEFRQYLDSEITINKCWLPSIDVELNLKIKPRDIIYISANIVKHGVSRLDKGVSNRIKAVLENNSISIEEDDWFELIKTFETWLFEDILSHQVTAMSEFVNNIKYGIYEYFLMDGVIYIDQKFYEPDKTIVKYCYFELISNVRSIPNYFPRFKSHHLLSGKNSFH
jgi:hypothetical protein